MISPTKARDLIFVHIPKTGGTSVRKSLVASGRWDENFLDYGGSSPETSPEVVDSMYGRPPIPLRSTLDPAANVLVAGHFVADKYGDQLPDADLATVLRYPVSQVLSHFRHHVARNGFAGGLVEFCRNPAFQNIQSKYLSGVALTKFIFVGILEWIQFDIITLSDLVGSKLPLLHLNRIDVLPSIPVTRKQIAMIESYNSEDMALYAAAIAHRCRTTSTP